MTTRLLVALVLLATPVAAQQYADPIDGTLSGTAWDAVCLGPTDACGCIGDGSNGLGDTTGDSSAVSEDDGSRFACGIDSLTDPSDTTNHFLRCRVYRSSNKANTFQFRLCNDSSCTSVVADSGAYEVTASSVALVTVPTDRGTMTAGAISDYTTLFIDVYATSTNPTDIFVTDCQLEVPAAAAGGKRRVVIVK